MEEKRDCLQEYRGYVGSVEYSEEDCVFFGKLIGIRDLVSYEGKTLELLVCYPLVQKMENEIDKLNTYITAINRAKKRG